MWREAAVAMSRGRDGWTFWLASGHAPQPPKVQRAVLRSAECGGTMRAVDITFEPTAALSARWHTWTADECHNR